MKNIIILTILVFSGCLHLETNHSNYLVKAQIAMQIVGQDVTNIEDPQIVITSLPGMRSIYKMYTGEKLKSKAFYLKATKQIYLSKITPEIQSSHEALHYYLCTLFPNMSFDMQHLIIGRMGY